MTHLPLPVDGSEKTFAVKIVNDSMTAATGGKKTFLMGDTIFIDPLKEYKSGDYVIAFTSNDNNAIFRQYIIDGNDRFLRALNADYQRITVDNSIKIVGVIIGHLAAL